MIRDSGCEICHSHVETAPDKIGIFNRWAVSFFNNQDQKESGRGLAPSLSKRGGIQRVNYKQFNALRRREKAIFL
jgi:hypothetical protein